MYIAEYYEPQLGGLGKLKIKKVLKKVVKIVKPIAHIAAAVVSGGATIPMSAQLIMASKQRKAQTAAMVREQAASEAAVKEMQAAAPLMVAPAAAPLMPTITTAPMAAQVSQAQLPVSYAPPPAARYETPEAPMRAPRRAAPAAAMPPWLIPVGIGGAALLAVTMMGRRGKGR